MTDPTTDPAYVGGDALARLLAQRLPPARIVAEPGGPSPGPITVRLIQSPPDMRQMFDDLDAIHRRASAAMRLPPLQLDSAAMATSLANVAARLDVSLGAITRQANAAVMQFAAALRRVGIVPIDGQLQRRAAQREARRQLSRRAFRRWRGKERAAWR